jgi:methionyl-tRNA formyltransferase
MGNTLKTYVLLSSKKWHDSLFESLKNLIDAKWIRINEQSEFSHQNLLKIQPDKVFIPHWSYIIEPDIYLNWECIVFHMTDLPYGRGGSPLQNLIARGHTETVISAIKVEEGLDTGDVYLKTPLSLQGTAEEIFIRTSDVIEKMIEEIINTNPIPKKQEGEVTIFKRRKPEQSNIENLETIDQVYNFIRMLDCEGYPNAYIETKHFKIEFNNAVKIDNVINAHVRITKK